MLLRLRHKVQDITKPLLNGLFRGVAGRADALLYKTALTRTEEIEIAAASGLRVLPWIAPDVSALPTRTDPASRARLRVEWDTLIPGGVDKFARILYAMIPDNVPLSLLENHPAIAQHAQRAFPTPPRVIASAVGWQTDEPFKLWAAEASERGSVLVGLQHGGGYGMRSMLPISEWFEMKVLDKFISWGWNADGAAVIPAGTPTHFFSGRQHHGRRDAMRLPIMFVGTSDYRYPNHFSSVPFGPHFLQQIMWQADFFRALPEILRAHVRVRLQPEDLGWRNEERLTAACGRLNIDRRNVPFTGLLQASELVIVDNLNTTLFEAMGRGIPTVLFWDRALWETNDEASAQIDMLEAAGIYHSTPQAAARHVSDISAEPQKWWLSQPVRVAVEAFLARYMRREQGWREEWVRILRDEEHVCASSERASR